MNLTVYGWAEKSPNDLEIFQNVWKVFGWLGKNPDDLESFRMVWKVSGWPRKFPDDQESFRRPGKFPYGLENIQIVLLQCQSTS